MCKYAVTQSLEGNALSDDLCTMYDACHILCPLNDFLRQPSESHVNATVTVQNLCFFNTATKASFFRGSLSYLPSIVV